MVRARCLISDLNVSTTAKKQSLRTSVQLPRGIMSNSQPRVIKHVHAHEAVITNEYWYGDGPPLMHPSLSARKTAERRVDVVELLEKAGNTNIATGDWKEARQFR